MKNRKFPSKNSSDSFGLGVLKLNMKMIAVHDIEALKRYFENRKDVAFAFLFGSQARGTATKL